MRVILLASEAEEALRDAEVVIFDTETFGNQPWRDGKILATIGVKPLGGESFVMPLRQGQRRNAKGKWADLWKPGNVCAAPLTARGKKVCEGEHWHPNAPLEELVKLMEMLRGKTLIPWNAKFDEAVLWQEGVDIIFEDVADAMVAWRLVSEDEPSYKLKWLASKYKLVDKDAAPEAKLKQFLKRHDSFVKADGSTGAKDQYFYNEASLEIIAPYLVGDLEYTEWLYTMATNKIEERSEMDVAEGREGMQLKHLFDLEKEVTKELFFLEKNGLKIDVPFVVAHRNQTRQKEKEADDAIISFAKEKLNTQNRRRGSLSRTDVELLDKAADLWKTRGMRFNPISHHDVKIIAQGMGLRPVYIYGQKTKGDSWDKAHIEKSAEESDDPEMKKFAELLVEVRSKKHLADYYDQMLALRDKNDFLHPSIQQGGTKTGRMSCIEPNMQNIPKRVNRAALEEMSEEEWDLLIQEVDDPGNIVKPSTAKDFLPVRHAFIPPDEDHIIVTVDWGQIELRILADYAGEEKWLTAFDLGLDVHSLAALAAGAPPEDQEQREKKWRFKGKQINLSIIYGIGNKRLGRTVHPEEDPGIAEKLAGGYKRDFRSRYPAIPAFLKKVEDRLEYRQQQLGGMFGWVASKWGRRRYLTVDKFYKGPNFMVQGTGADFLKEVTRRLRHIREQGLAKMVDIVHDEFIFYVHLDNVEAAIPIIVLTMETSDRIFSVRLKADVSWSNEAWDEVKSLNCESCAGAGSTYSKTPAEMFDMMVADKWDDLKALRGTGEPCDNCDGRGFDLTPVIEYREEKRRATRLSTTK